MYVKAYRGFESHLLRDITIQPGINNFGLFFVDSHALESTQSRGIHSRLDVYRMLFSCVDKKRPILVGALLYSDAFWMSIRQMTLSCGSMRSGARYAYAASVSLILYRPDNRFTSWINTRCIARCRRSKLRYLCNIALSIPPLASAASKAE